MQEDRGAATDALVTDAEGVVSLSRPPSTFEGEAITALGQRLFELSDEATYAAFSGSADTGVGVILLCGYSERFRTIRLLECMPVDCLMVQDPVSPWYTGSPRCPGLDHIHHLARARFPRVRRWLLVGQSSGGYAALRLSRMIEGSLALALAPQTFDDNTMKGNAVFFPPSFQLSRTLSGANPVEDLRSVFFGTPANGSSAYIVSAFSEHQNPPTEWLWMDAMHWGRLVDHPDVRVFVTEGTSHPVLLRHIHVYAALLRRLADHPTWASAEVVALIAASVYGTTDATGG